NVVAEGGCKLETLGRTLQLNHPAYFTMRSGALCRRLSVSFLAYSTCPTFLKSPRQDRAVPRAFLTACCDKTRLWTNSRSVVLRSGDIFFGNRGTGPGRRELQIRQLFYSTVGEFHSVVIQVSV